MRLMLLICFKHDPIVMMYIAINNFIRRDCMNIDFNLFMNDAVRQARQEIVDAGYTELKSAEEVDEALTKKGNHTRYG